MEDEFDTPLFAFHDLSYIPYGFSSSKAPYIETPGATMRAAATLMRLGASAGAEEVASIHQEVKTVATVVCDLGCGDGEFLMGLLGHINALAIVGTPAAHGIGIDYNAELIQNAGMKAKSEGRLNLKWLIYDFNDDEEDLVAQLLTTHQVTHMFIALVPKQLALPNVRRILTQLCEKGVVVCCYKFHPDYLTPARRDTLMDLVVYDVTS